MMISRQRQTDEEKYADLIEGQRLMKLRSSHGINRGKN